MKKIYALILLITYAIICFPNHTKASCGVTIFNSIYNYNCNNLNSTIVDSFITSNNCDSVVTTYNIGYPKYNKFLSDTICLGSNYTFLDGSSQAVYSYLTHTNNFVSVNGCDSIIVQEINLNLTYSNTNYEFKCQGDSLVTPNFTLKNLKSDTLFQLNYKTKKGCDSNLAYQVFVAKRDTTILYNYTCYNGNVILADSSYIDMLKKDTLIYTQFYNQFFCDSIVVNNIDVQPIIASHLYDTVCYFKDYYGPGNNTFYELTVDTLIEINFPKPGVSCDSIVFAHISVTKADTSMTVNFVTLSVPNTNNATFQWYNGLDSLPINNAKANVFTPVANGKFFVKITYRGCTFYSNTYSVFEIAIDNKNLLQTNIIPNPFTNKLSWGDNITGGTISITNYMGQNVYTGKEKVLNTKQWLPGFYYATIFAEGKKQVIKLVKQ